MAARVQQGTPADRHDAWCTLSVLVCAHAGTADRLGRWLRWATHSDGAVPLTEADLQLLALLSEAAVEAGLLEEPILPQVVETTTWPEIPAGLLHRTSRLRD